MGTLSHGHLAQNPSHHKEANKFRPAVYLDSAANYQVLHISLSGSNKNT